MLAAPAEAAAVEELPKAPTPPPPAGNANIYALRLAWSGLITDILTSTNCSYKPKDNHFFRSWNQQIFDHFTL